MSPETSIWVSTAKQRRTVIWNLKPVCVSMDVCTENKHLGGELGPDEVLAGVTTQVLPCFHGHHFTHKYPGYQKQCWELRSGKWEGQNTGILLVTIYTKHKGNSLLKIVLLLTYNLNQSHGIHCVCQINSYFIWDIHVFFFYYILWLCARFWMISNAFS